MSLDPQHQPPARARRRRRLRRRAELGPWWRRISWIRTGAVLFCLAVWALVAHACLTGF